ncbi:MAG: hypothetical protein JW982_08380 [Spirochaetes bacterium]|nr:hypothetical protein [Spirochaetota bacterium]
MRKLLFSAVIIFCCAQSLFAARVFKDQKRIAVTSFSANNLEEHYATIARNMLETELYKTGAFIVLERDQIELVAKENRIANYGNDDTKTAVEIGQVVSADFALICSIDYLEKYYITVRAVRVKEGDVYAIVTEDFEDINELKPEIIRVAEKIKTDLKKSSLVSGQWTFQTFVTFMSPHDSFDRLVNINSPLLQLRLGYDNLFMNNLSLGLSVGYIDMDGAGEGEKINGLSFSKIQFFPVLISTGYYINVSKRLRFAPVVSAGYAYSYLHYYDAGINDEKTDSRMFEILAAGLNFEILLAEGVGLVFDCGVMDFIYEGNNMIASCGSLGFAFYF